MNRKRRIHTFFFILLDGIAATLSWGLFYAYRKFFIEADKFGYRIPLELSNNFFWALGLVPAYWIILYFLSGYYKNVWGKSRIKEISNTFSISVMGVVLLFFILLLDDEVKSYESYYKTTLTLFCLHFGLTLTERLFVASYIIRQFRKKKLGFNTIIVGNNQRSLGLVKEILNGQNV